MVTSSNELCRIAGRSRCDGRARCAVEPLPPPVTGVRVTNANGVGVKTGVLLAIFSGVFVGRGVFVGSSSVSVRVRVGGIAEAVPAAFAAIRVNCTSRVLAAWVNTAPPVSG